MDLQEWISAQVVADGMLWKGAFGAQVQFVRDTIAGLMGIGTRERAPVTVISTHRSKSIDLPVYRIDRSDLGLAVILRDNFYNWKLSVISERPVSADFSGLFYTTPPVEPDYTGDCLHPVYFEGFPPDLIFGYYEPSDKLKWSAEINGDYQLFTALFLLLKNLGAVKPFVWHTRESYRRELDEESARRKAETR